MKKIFLLIVTIISITACTKPTEQLPESFVGQMRSKYPNIKISGISVNDKIICEFKSSLWHWGPGGWGYYYRWTEIYSDGIISKDPVFLISETDFLLSFIVYKNVINDESIAIHLYNENSDYGLDLEEIDVEEYNSVSDNVESYTLKRFSLVPDSEITNLDCGLEIEITMKNGDIIEIVYCGEANWDMRFEHY